MRISVIGRGSRAHAASSAAGRRAGDRGTGGRSRPGGSPGDGERSLAKAQVAQVAALAEAERNARPTTSPWLWHPICRATPRSRA